MAYVPPHLKNRQGNLSGLSGISNSIRPTTTSSQFYSLHELSTHLDIPLSSFNTLTVSPASPDDLLAILLHEGQHPDWASAHKILCKSNLNVLRKIPTDRADNQDLVDIPDTPSPSMEYPLFAEVPFFQHGSSKKFEFAGWWRTTDVQFLEPNSKELIALFERKFGGQSPPGGRKRFSGAFANASNQREQGKRRTEGAWKDSLTREWAVVSLERNEARKDSPISDTLRQPSASVAEVLENLRKGGTNQTRVETSNELEDTSSVKKEV
ncbi:hypothetical protein M0805_002549 [Coniferiporia weirii]|nr:hypothetical protein M0805_002549 [Coniferiporia weirii]